MKESFDHMTGSNLSTSSHKRAKGTIISRKRAKADRQPECDKDVQEIIEKHLRHFCDMYMKEANDI